MKKVYITLSIIVLLLAYFFLTAGTQIEESEPETFFMPPTDEVLSLEPIELENELPDFVLNQAPKEGIVYTRFYNQPSLDTFLMQVDARIQPQINQLMDQDSWRLYRCADNPTVPYSRISLSMETRLLPDYKGNLYRDRISYMRQWESTIAGDMANILYPQVNSSFSPAVFSSLPGFEHINLRAGMAATGGEEYQVVYILVGDTVVVGNDVDCTVEVQESLFDTSA